MMKKFIFFTKTDWNEPPRLRHQLARLLVSYKHKIIFFEKPTTFLFGKKIKLSKENGITFIRSKQLIHRLLRIFKMLTYLNTLFELRVLKNRVKNIKILKEDIIVNFNYDYYFLRSLFPENYIVTIINDDFWCRALFGYEKPLKDVLDLTCKMSDSVLAVSYPLVEQLSVYCNPQLLLPWSDLKYKRPNMEVKKYRLLFWGYINNRLNFDYIIKLANALKESDLDIVIEFIGPEERKIDLRYIELKKHPNIRTEGPTDIQNLNFDTVLGAFIPYVDGNKADDATTIPNKAFPMLANGLPLLITGMPHFIDEPFVFRLGEDLTQDIQLILTMNKKLPSLQTYIEKFVNTNTSDKRYQEFMSTI
tara:strand:- start:6907 stop:7992 length:1086 start_codon:yes stop_codon:yes gene_type:complete